MWLIVQVVAVFSESAALGGAKFPALVTGHRSPFMLKSVFAQAKSNVAPS